MKEKLFSRFKEELAQIYHIGSALAVLNWDREVYMPPKGVSQRAVTVSNLAGILHQKFISPEFEKILKDVKKEMDRGNLSDEEAGVVREIRRDFERSKKIPTEFIKELAKTCSEAHDVWAKARKKSEFKKFLPYLKKIVELKREEADLVGYDNSPYDALLDVYEPGLETKEASVILDDLKDFLVPFLKKIKKSKVKINPQATKGNFPVEKQIKFNRKVAKDLGFDFNSGRIDVSVHPFATGFHPQDVRVTTRYKKDDLFYSLFGIIHEVGHALYEQGLLPEHFGTPLGEAISLGIHESQSRMWENIVGRGKPFWKYFYPILRKEFPKPFQNLKFEDFYQSINYVEPTPIRVEADEVTYNLHVILRFEIERELVEGSIAVEDLPKIWNDKMKDYLGVRIKNDAEGVLQDVHWSGGAIGYFPTYTLGNIYSAQFYKTAKKEILNLEKEIERCQFGHLREWLKKKIHVHGKLFPADDLVKQVTGEGINASHFIDYLEKKYSDIYKISVSK